ncbi:Hypothetical protein PBC10988_30560 [Planctomycetales bacterium 10988]|nr:Hypothetical protein PBC10988_30560 [Planctomycetales bacterium 10988]
MFHPTRRSFLYSLGASIGSVAFTAMMADQLLAETSEKKQNSDGPLAAKPQQIPAKAKNCIFLMMEGGPSHIDTFDPKPKLEKLHLSEFVRNGEMKSAMESGKRYYVQSPFSFRKAGQSGASISTNWEHLADCVDDLCFYRGMQVDSVNHPTAMYQMNTGNRFGGDPGIGSWVTYGLGTENQNLPGFVVLPEVSFPQGGAANWGAGFLPAHFQGTPLRPKGSPILDLEPMKGISRAHQRANLDLLQNLNQRHHQDHPYHDELLARMSSYELAFRMQAQVPDLLNIDQETPKIREMYGIDQNPTDAFGRKCLLARKLIEKGVRFVQLYAGTWDSHDYIERAHGNLIQQVDRPIAALLKDLKQRGLLESTLVVWCGEFGRSPDNGVRGGTAYGRDHNPKAMTVWMAGGGVKAGHTIGATDETGAEAVECVHHVRDFHVTLLRLLGLDDNKLTYFHGGRFKQLSQFGGEVIQELLA